MSASSLRKAVYFNRDELELKEWAEERPEGFSAYIKHLITEDLQEQRQRALINQAISDFFLSRVGQDTLAQALARALGGKTIIQYPGEGQEAAAQLELSEIEQIASFITGR